MMGLLMNAKHKHWVLIYRFMTVKARFVRA
jgi:hypothetical protein